MKNFKIFQDGTEVLVGDNYSDKVFSLLKKYGAKRVLLHYGMGSIKKNGLYDKIVSGLKKEKIIFFEVGGVKPNPIVEKVREAVKVCQDKKVDFILAVGGGSVIDSAKAVAGAAAEKVDPWDYYIGKKIAEKAIPIGVVLTIPATGSESNGGTVLSNGDKKKVSMSPHFVPKFAILDPINIFTLPKDQTAYGIVDMFLHTAEQYFTPDENITIIEHLCEGLMKGVVKISKDVIDNPKNSQFRMESLWAGNIALSGFLRKGTSGGDWATHMIEHEISAINDMAHGAGLAVVFPAWLQYVGRKKPYKVLKYGKAVFDVETVEDTVLKTREFFESIGVDTYIKDGSIKEEHFEKIATEATGFMKLGRYVELNHHDVIEIMKISVKN